MGDSVASAFIDATNNTETVCEKLQQVFTAVMKSSKETVQKQVDNLIKRLQTEQIPGM